MLHLTPPSRVCKGASGACKAKRRVQLLPLYKTKPSTGIAEEAPRGAICMHDLQNYILTIFEIQTCIACQGTISWGSPSVSAGLRDAGSLSGIEDVAAGLRWSSCLPWGRCPRTCRRLWMGSKRIVARHLFPRPSSQCQRYWGPLLGDCSMAQMPPGFPLPTH